MCVCVKMRKKNGLKKITLNNKQKTNQTIWADKNQTNGVGVVVVCVFTHISKQQTNKRTNEQTNEAKWKKINHGTYQYLTFFFH